MKNLLIVLVLLAMVIPLTGCGNTPWSPEAKLLAARESFDGTVEILTLHRNAGAFTKTEGTAILTAARMGELILDQWQAALKLKQSPAGPIERFNYVMRELTAKQIAAERKAKTKAVKK